MCRACAEWGTDSMDESSRNPNRSLAGVRYGGRYAACMEARMSFRWIAALACGLALASAQTGGKTQPTLEKAIQTEMVDGDLRSDIEQYKAIAEGKDRALAAKAPSGLCSRWDSRCAPSQT